MDARRRRAGDDAFTARAGAGPVHGLRGRRSRGRAPGCPLGDGDRRSPALGLDGADECTRQRGARTRPARRPVRSCRRRALRPHHGQPALRARAAGDRAGARRPRMERRPRRPRGDRPAHRRAARPSAIRRRRAPRAVVGHRHGRDPGPAARRRSGAGHRPAPPWPAGPDPRLARRLPRRQGAAARGAPGGGGRRHPGYS